jgi:putative phosphoesterase
MRIALIADIHGNRVALEAVLAALRRDGVDRLVCLGDVATLGPEPGPVVETLRELACPCVLGNHDAFLLEPSLVASYTEAPPVVGAVDWCRERLPADALDFLRTFRPTVELELELEGSRLLLFHGTPRSSVEDLLATTPADALDRMLEGVEATLLACGHTHVQLLRQHRGRLIVNPGSVGFPFLEPVGAGGGPPTLLPHAEYAVVTLGAGAGAGARGAVGVELRRLPLDGAALRRAAEACDSPLQELLLEHARRAA